MKLADQSRLTERMETRPFVVDRPPVEIEADDIAPTRARLDRLVGPPSETAAKIEMVRIVRCSASATVRK
jgi:hypothetical protein